MKTFIEQKSDQLIVEQTKKWITEVVIGCNFCPFASREFTRETIQYRVDRSVKLQPALEALMLECQRLDNEPGIETTLVILPEGFQKFNEYLDLVDLAEEIMQKSGYEGVYQLASFHPLYRFAGSKADDPANYTNRSVYPMLHLLREASIEKALSHYADPEQIPDNNIRFAREKGITYMKALWEAAADGGK
jgi:hypothetical protein